MPVQYLFYYILLLYTIISYYLIHVIPQDGLWLNIIIRWVYLKGNIKLYRSLPILLFSNNIFILQYNLLFSHNKFLFHTWNKLFDKETFLFKSNLISYSIV